MKILHIILTVVAVLASISSFFQFVNTASYFADNNIPMHIGIVIGSIAAPGTFWLARYIVGRLMAKEKA